MSLAQDSGESDVDFAVGWNATASLPDRRAEAAVADLLLALGCDVDDANLVGTPQRVVASFRELLRREPLTMTTFPNEEGYDDLVLVREIPFTSLCAHHLLPFRGVAHVGYLPGTRLLGLSKLARVVEHFARDLQLQERLTVQIADYLTSALTPNGVGVVLEAEHLCMSIRGAHAPTARTRTARFTGALAEHGWERFGDMSPCRV
ncbi:MAG TPA: GTP cyclohydrolase I [Microbacterium sp.]|nr:GTP cyclohydrolase I [Microbacterium sp.]